MNGWQLVLISLRGLGHGYIRGGDMEVGAGSLITSNDIASSLDGTRGTGFIYMLFVNTSHHLNLFSKSA